MSTTIYPLKWPEGWPRTPREKRERGVRFRTGGYNGSLPTFNKARSDVFAELAMMRVTSATLSTNVQVRQDGSVFSGVDPNKFNMENPGVAITFMRKGRPFIMAQDAFDTVGCNLRSMALALEAMRAIERHGGGTMAGKAFDGFSALPPPAGSRPRRPWWEVLRYSEDPTAPDREFLSASEVEARFKAMAKKLHPDAGGTDVDMQELVAARDDAVADLTSPEES